MTTPMLKHTPEYAAMLRRYSELHERYMSDKLSRPETIEFVKIMQKLSIAELEHDARAKGNEQ